MRVSGTAGSRKIKSGLRFHIGYGGILHYIYGVYYVCAFCISGDVRQPLCLRARDVGLVFLSVIIQHPFYMMKINMHSSCEIAWIVYLVLCGHNLDGSLLPTVFLCSRNRTGAGAYCRRRLKYWVHLCCVFFAVARIHSRE